MPVLGVVGMSLSLASGASAATGAPATGMPSRNTAAGHQVTLNEEEVSDVSLATFYVFDKENAGTPRLGERFARACGGCRGCRGCRGCGGCGGGSWGRGDIAASANDRALPITLTDAGHDGRILAGRSCGIYSAAHVDAWAGRLAHTRGGARTGCCVASRHRSLAE